jgi:hypothetical protein
LSWFSDTFDHAFHSFSDITDTANLVMVQFGVSTVEDAMKLGREAVDYISGTFTKVNRETLTNMRRLSRNSYQAFIW